MKTRIKQLALIVLLFSLAVTLAYRQFYGSSATGRGSVEPSNVRATEFEEGLRIGKVGNVDGVSGENRRSIFDFGRVIVPARAPQRVDFKTPVQPEEDRTPQGPEGPPPGPPVPPTPQPLPLLYTGYARETSSRMTAFLETRGANAPAGHYNLQERDFLLGRYRINRITTEAVEVEDLDRAETATDRKRTIAISPSIAGRK